MRQLLLATALCTLPALSALAADYQSAAPVTAATVYPQGATVTRKVRAELPAGAHRILFPVRGAMMAYGPPRIAVSAGVALGATQLLRGYVTDPEGVYTSGQAAARDRVEALEDELTARRDEIARAQTALAAAEARRAFVASLKGGALERIEPEALGAAADLVARETATAQLDAQQAREAVRALEETLRDLTRELTQAKASFARLTPPEGPVDMMAVSVELDAPQEVVVDVQYLEGGASWRPDYDMYLTRGEQASIRIDRKAVVQQYTGEIWDGVDLVLSTADPFAGVVPTEPQPNQARIGTDAPKRMPLSGAAFDAAPATEEMRLQAEPVEAARQLAAGVKVEGLSVTYEYPRKVTLSPEGGDGLQLALDTVTLEAREKIIAAPRSDTTAFLLAETRNTLPEPILPGEASIYRDGVFLGRSLVPLIPAGAEEDLSFGPLEALRLEWKLLDNDTGDKGIVSRSDTREQALEFSVENLGDAPVELTALFALPYSEQEDLEVEVRARPAPTRVDHDKKRGLGAWDMALAAGEKQVVRVDLTFDWPSGSQLYWMP